MKGSYIFNDVIDFSQIGTTGDFISKIPFMSKNTRFDSLDIDVSSGVIRYNNIDVYTSQGWAHQKYKTITLFEEQDDNEWSPNQIEVEQWILANSTALRTKKRVKLTKTKEDGTADKEEIYPKAYVTDLMNEDGSQWIPSLGGSGGMGGGGSGAVSITTITNPELVTSLGVKTELEFEWSSEADGNGTLYIYVDGELKKTALAKQGKVKVDVSNYITSATDYLVRLVVEDAFGSKRALNYQVSVINLIVNSTFDQTLAQTGAITYRYTPYGSVTKTMHFFIDGVEYTSQVEETGREQTFEIPNGTLTHGVHTLKVYATATFGETTVYSNELNYKFAYYQEGNSTPIIVIFNEPNQTFDEGQTVKINYLVYTATSETTDITLYLNGYSQSLTVDRQAKVWSITDYNQGVNTIKIATDTNYETTTFNIVESEITITPVTTGLELFLSSNGKSNNVSSKDEWTYGEIETTFNNFNFVSDGWLEDSDGIVGLKMTGDANIEIGYQPFKDDAKDNGKTIELEFATSNVTNFDATVINIMSDNRGILVKPNEIFLKSTGKEVSTRFKEEEHIRISLVIERSTANRFISIYINGVLSGIDVYGDNDDYEQINAVNIKAGSTECDLTLYKIRCYNNSLTASNILDNYIADNDNYDLKTKLYRRNQIYDAYGTVLYNKVKNIMPVLLITAPILPSAKDDVRKLTSLKLENINNPQLNWEYTNLDFEIQGTSSVQYPVKNLEFKFGEDVIQLYPDAILENRLTLKVDYASSAGVFNMGNAKIVNEIYQEKNPRQNEDSRVRNALYGYPVAVFYRKTPSDNWQFHCKGSLNLSKKANAMGYKEGDESWEVKNSTSPLCLFQTDDFRTLSSDFEARYNKSGSSKNLETLIKWVYDCRNDPQLFSDECEEHFNLHYLLMYYVYGQIMGGADSYAKNLYLTFFAEGQNEDGTYYGKWYPQFYDLDTSYGINNTGELKFEYSTELHDKYGENYAFNGHDSVLWNLVEQVYADELKALYQALRNGQIVTYDSIMEILQVQGIEQYPEAIYNEDAQIKYIEPYLAAIDYLDTALGSTLEHLKYWVANRLKYLDSKWIASSYSLDRIAARITTPEGATKDYSITLKSKDDMYMQIQQGSYYANVRAKRNQEYTLEPDLQENTEFNDTETYIYGASSLTYISDLSKWYLSLLKLGAATSLTEIKVGDSSANYENPNLTTLEFGANKLLRSIDISNCSGLTGNIDLSQCNNLQYLYAGGTQLTSVSFANGGQLKIAVLPDTITSMTLINLTSIQSITTTGVFSTIRIENSNVDSLDYVQKSIAAGKLERLRLLGVDWTIESKDMLDYLVENVKGINSIGNNQDKSVIAGKIHINNNMFSDDIQDYEEYWGTSLKITANSITNRYKATFKNYDGSILYETRVFDNQEVVYYGATPTRPNDEIMQQGFRFVGWDKPLEAITSNTVFIAQYEVVPLIKCTFKNYDGTILGTSLIPSGTLPVYNGVVPTRPDDKVNGKRYFFIGWKPSISGVITSDTTFTADYDEVDLYLVQFVNYDGEVLQEDFYGEGEFATYTGNPPTRPSDAQYIYTFSGWSPNPENTAIVANTTFTAGYSLKALCKVTLKNADGTVFYEIGVVNGEQFDYHSKPTPPDDDAQFKDYKFASWQLNGVDVTLPITVTTNITLTPRFEGTLRKYSVFWFVNGELKETDGDVAYGTVGVTYDGVTPESTNEGEMFKGWVLTPGATEIIDIGTYQVIGDTYLYAKFVGEDGIILTVKWDNTPTTDLTIRVSVDKPFTGELANEYVLVDWGDGVKEEVRSITTRGTNGTCYYKDVTHTISNYNAGVEYNIKILKVGTRYIFTTQSQRNNTGIIFVNNKEALRRAKINTYMRNTYELFMSNSNLEEVIFSDQITRIDGFCLYNCTKLKEVSLPNSILNIGEDAFGYSGLTSVTIPDSVTSIGKNFLNYCSSLTTINIGKNAKFVIDEYFTLGLELNNLEFINVYPENQNLQSIDNVLYSKDVSCLIKYPAKKNTANYSMPNTVEQILGGAFEGNKTRKTVQFSNNLKYIRYSAFKNSLFANSKIELPDSVIKVGNSAFYGSSLVEVILNNGVNISETNTFYNCSISTIKFKGNLEQWLNTKLTDSSLYNASNINFYLLNSNGEYEKLVNIVVPNTVTEIRNYAFRRFKSVTSVLLPNGITKIGRMAFSETNIQNITLPNTLSTMDDYAFLDCSYLTNVNFEENSVIKYLPSYCFDGCTRLNQINLPNSLTSLNNYSIFQESGLTSITIPDSVTHIGSNCFSQCHSLVEIIIGSSVASISSNAFRQTAAVTNRKVICKAATPPTIQANTFTSSYFNAANGCEIIVPTTSETDYEGGTNWSTWADIIEGGAENYV